MDLNLSNQIILVAGGTGGLGRAVSLVFLAEGAKVAVTYRKPQEFEALQQSAGPNAPLEGHIADVTDTEATTQLVQKILATHNRLDVLVNTAGGYTGGIKLWDLDPKLLDQMLNLNLRAGYALARAAVPAMLKQGSGSIINVAARAAVDHAAGASAYAASKAAAVALFDSLAADLKGTGVRANSILPNIIDTPINRKAMPTANYATWPKPEDLARVILFLASDQSRVIHGAAIPLYGNAEPSYQ